MKILRSKGTSFTVFDTMQDGDKTKRLARGLLSKADRNLMTQEFADGGVIAPSRLVEYVSTDHALALRQTVSGLDKVIRKPRSLRGFERQAYIDRTLLSVELWNWLHAKHRDAILKLDNGNDALREFQRTWNAKVHPYARKKFDPVSPGTDDNAKFIHDKGDPGLSRSDFNGRWHDALWKTANGRPDYSATADAILNHLWAQDLKINGEDRTYRRECKPTGRGVVETRGRSMVKSANDPRTSSKRKEVAEWDTPDEVLYFQSDVAKHIFDDLMSHDGRNAPFQASRFGKHLYEHFGAVMPSVADDDEGKKRLWSLHNRVRQHYQRIGRSTRFRRACRAEDNGELAKIVPANSAKLLEGVRAKSRNADISELVRLGKLIVHATDLPGNTENVESVVQDRMNDLVTSAGQSEIKRNEALTRVWRNAVGLSMRTLKAWADPENKAEVPLNSAEADEEQATDDVLASSAVAKQAIKNFDPDHYARHTRLVFGDRSVGDSAGRSRASLFLPENDTEKTELLWAMLRLAGELRNRTNHFNTKPRLMGVVANELLSEVSDREHRSFAGRPKDRAEKHALDTFKALLDFDQSLQKQVLVDELNRLQVSEFVDPSDRKTLLTELAETRVSNAITTPRFMSMLKHVKNLSVSDPESLHDTIKPFATLDLDPGAMTRQGVNHCRLGILRLLYGTGFQAWLATLGSEEGIIGQAVATVIQAKKARIKQFQGEVYQFYKSAETAVDALVLDTTDDLASLLHDLASHSATVGRVRQTYRPNSRDQQKRSSWVDTFRQELFAHLFGRYLEDWGLAWIWTIEEPEV